ncbi:MAG: hypothetical protein IJA08_05390 [Clostridia bacterium]|nr:hypothetical protein [Clostridia bacterium]
MPDNKKLYYQLFSSITDVMEDLEEILRKLNVQQDIAYEEYLCSWDRDFEENVQSGE